MDDAADPAPLQRMRVANACNACKARKVKCDGDTPCGYCTRRQRSQHCRYTPQQRRRPRARSTSNVPTPSAVAPPLLPPQRPTPEPVPERPSSARSFTTSQHDSGQSTGAEETEVPREARLLCDAQGKLVFVGDCAPLSFFQSVRRLVTARVDHDAFAPQTSRYTVLENAPYGLAGAAKPKHPPKVDPRLVASAVSEYLSVTAGVVDLFSRDSLEENIISWVSRSNIEQPDDAVVNYLVLAIGCQQSHRDTAQSFFEYARDQAFIDMTGNLAVGTVQAFILITLYMLLSCQLNGAFLLFGIAARAAYSIGIHRTEVNARFGVDMHRQRDRLWKSLRVVDLFLSTSMGRPPSTSDVDCTVSYRCIGPDGVEAFGLLNASAQIFLIVEGIVLEVYSRRKISLQLTEGISRELRDWSDRWLPQLKDAVAKPPPNNNVGHANGACQVLGTYYYAVILVARPFLMYELHRRLSDGYLPSVRNSGRSKLADACIDAANLMVDPVQELIKRGDMTSRAPGLVSWLFASCLVLGLGLLGGFGRILEKQCQLSIDALEYFAETDAHAKQYALIARSLLATALEYLDKREAQERSRRTESSSQLFGLVPREHADARESGPASSLGCSMLSKDCYRGGKPDQTRPSQPGVPSPQFDFDLDTIFSRGADAGPQTSDFSIMGGAFDVETDPSFSALNLFPLLETSGDIDLANYF